MSLKYYVLLSDLKYYVLSYVFSSSNILYLEMIIEIFTKIVGKPDTKTAGDHGESAPTSEKKK